MKTKLQNEFKNAQISIYQKEKALHAETQRLLSDLLSSMSKKEREAANDMELELEFELGTLSHIVEMSPSAITITEYDEPVKKSLDDLTQPQQKAIIDSILLNVFKI